MFVSHAQNFEDVILWRALKHVENGFYIDIGAQDPVNDSVSRGFYEKGWRGIHADASPFYADKIRLDRPDELVIQAAIGTGQGKLNFFEIADTGLSTGDARIADMYRKAGKVLREVEVEILPLSSILEMAGDRQIHWMKIDVEGMEASVIKSWAEAKARPWILVVEATEPNAQTPSHEPWEQILLGYGYIYCYFDGLSRFYVNETQSRLIKYFGPGPNVFDQFMLPSHSGFVDPTPRREMELFYRAEISSISAQLLHEKELVRSFRESTSWKVTAPLRKAGHIGHRIRENAAAWTSFELRSSGREAARWLLTHLMLWVRQRPRLARTALNALSLFPFLQRRVVLAAQARGMALSIQTASGKGDVLWHLDVDPEIVTKLESLGKKQQEK